MRRTSLQDVAQRAEVSPTTVSFVLNGRTREMGIGETTRARVLRAAEELGYRPNRVAGSLARGRTRTVGVVVPNLGANIVARLVHGIEAACSARDHRVIVAQARGGLEAPKQQAQLLLEHRVDGLICASGRYVARSEAEWLSRLSAEGVACVLVDGPDPSGRVDAVVSDDYGGARSVVAHLARLGHRRIAHLAGDPELHLGQDRLAGYRAGLADAGIAGSPELEVTFLGSRASYENALTSLLALPEPPTAIFAGSDHLAADVMRFALQRGVRIPGDLALVGAGDVSLAAHLGLTTINHPARELGVCAVERLFARLEDPIIPIEQIALPTRLVVRASCGGLPPEHPDDAPPPGGVTGDSSR
jgi:LacI family transcriptional regulator